LDLLDLMPHLRSGSLLNLQSLSVCKSDFNGPFRRGHSSLPYTSSSYYRQLSAKVLPFKFRVLHDNVHERLWLTHMGSHVDSVALWQLFMKTHRVTILERGLTASLHRRAPRILKDETESVIPIHLYIPRIVCANLEWIAILTICMEEPDLDRTGWIQISKMNNLGTLWVDISNTKDHGFDDVVIKAWSNSARYSNGFPVLKFLHIQASGGFEFDILSYLEAIPSLRVFHWQKFSYTVACLPISNKPLWLSTENSNLCSELVKLVGSNNLRSMGTPRTILDAISSWDAGGRVDLRGIHPTLHVICGTRYPPVDHWSKDFDDFWFEKVQQANSLEKVKLVLRPAGDHDEPPPKRPRLKKESTINTSDLLNSFAH
jgi:hypothetical protein